jgi:hypothetical protein
MLYETAAQAEEILILNVEDLDPEFRRARVASDQSRFRCDHAADLR